jgi:hypothetical protein
MSTISENPGRRLFVDGASVELGYDVEVSEAPCVLLEQMEQTSLEWHTTASCPPTDGE